MDYKQLNKYIGLQAKNLGFELAFGNWYIESDEVIIIINLQKSNYSNLFYFNIKIFIQNIFGLKYTINKFLFKNDVGDIFTRLPDKYNYLFDLDYEIEDKERYYQLDKVFSDYLVYFTHKALTIKGIKELYKSNEILLLPAIKEAIIG